MTDQAIREALNEGMLEAARAATMLGEYEEALEDILTVLAVDPSNEKAHVLLLKLGLLFFARNREIWAGPTPTLDLPFKDLLQLDVAVRFYLDAYNANDELFWNSGLRVLPSYFLGTDEREALLRLLRQGLGAQVPQSLELTYSLAVRESVRKICLVSKWARP